jgi:hypothetical protein
LKTKLLIGKTIFHWFVSLLFRSSSNKNVWTRILQKRTDFFLNFPPFYPLGPNPDSYPNLNPDPIRIHNPGSYRKKEVFLPPKKEYKFYFLI